MNMMLTHVGFCISFIFGSPLNRAMGKMNNKSFILHFRSHLKSSVSHLCSKVGFLFLFPKLMSQKQEFPLELRKTSSTDHGKFFEVSHLFLAYEETKGMTASSSR